MTPALLPTTPEGRRWRIAEECGEVVQALGKAGRFGLDGCDPRTGISNARAILDELADLRHAIQAVELDLTVVTARETAP